MGMRDLTQSGRLATTVATGGTIVVLLHALDLLGPVDSLTFVVLAAGAVFAATVGLIRYRPEPRWVWVSAVTALLLFFMAGALRQTFDTLGDLTASREWYPEPFSVLGYLALGAMMFGVARSRLGPQWRERNGILDALIAGLASMALAWIYLITPAFERSEASLTVRLALAAYPALSIFLLTIGFRIGFSAPSRPPIAFRLLIFGLLATCVGEVLYTLVELHYLEYNSWIDASYGLAFVGVMTAMLHPSMPTITHLVPDDTTRPRRGLSIVAMAVSVPGIMLLFQPEAGVENRGVLAAILIALMVAAGVRVSIALREHADFEAKLVHQATHDSLTDLPNRVFLEEALGDALADEAVDGHPFLALLFLDLDRFKIVNDTLGHTTGDLLLNAVAARLRRNVRPNDLVMRIGGDEFVVLADRVRSEDEAREIAERTRLMFMTPFKAGEAEITVSTSIGVTLARPGTPDIDADSLLREADTAMYGAKDLGGNAVVIFDEAMHDRMVRRLLLERDIRGAADRGELSLRYQPIVQVNDRRITGFEALLRWEHPVLGDVPPGDFIPVCEETGYIIELGGWVIDQAIAFLSELRSKHDHSDELSMAINVSARQLRDPQLCDQVARALLEHGVPARAVCLEITESMLVENLSAITETLATLRKFGARISIDDFGTGYSSLSYLRRLPVDEIKIDRQFVRHLGEDHADDSLVAAILAMAGSLDYTTVAEGVETPNQLSRLVQLGCKHAQGFGLGRPMVAGQLDLYIEQMGLAAAPRLQLARDLTRTRKSQAVSSHRRSTSSSPAANGDDSTDSSPSPLCSNE
jgi:diguanylate cyclase